MFDKTCIFHNTTVTNSNPSHPCLHLLRQHIPVGVALMPTNGRTSMIKLTGTFNDLGYCYIGARTDTTQQTNICLGIHCRNVWLHLNRQPFCPLQRHSNPMRTAASLWPDCRLETNSLCWCQTVGGDNIAVSV